MSGSLWQRWRRAGRLSTSWGHRRSKERLSSMSIAANAVLMSGYVDDMEMKKFMMECLPHCSR
jgi:hypothetical protein